MANLTELLAQMAGSATKEGYSKGVEGIQARDAAALTAQAKLQELIQGPKRKAEEHALNTASDLQQFDTAKKTHPNLSGLGSVHDKVIDPTMSGIRQEALDFRKETAKNNQAAALTTKYDKQSMANSSLRDIDAISDHDGKGGILTNPNAQLKSTGKIMSKIPTSVLALGEMLGVVDKGVSEERKSLDRNQLAYQNSISGVRTTDQMAAREREATGWVASGDPELVKKGLIAQAQLQRERVALAGAGASDEVKHKVNSDLGYDPMEFYNKVAQREHAVKAPPLSPRQQLEAARAKRGAKN